MKKSQYEGIKNLIEIEKDKLSKTADEHIQDGLKKHIRSLEKKIQDVTPEPDEVLKSDAHDETIKNLRERLQDENDPDVIKGIEKHIGHLELKKEKFLNEEKETVEFEEVAPKKKSFLGF